jgi:hypothetical protein
MVIKLTKSEQRKFKYMRDLFGGKGNVDEGKIKTRILRLRKRKTGRTTARDMEDILGY